MEQLEISPESVHVFVWVSTMTHIGGAKKFSKLNKNTF